jgi:putative acetyltransferase
MFVGLRPTVPLPAVSTPGSEPRNPTTVAEVYDDVSMNGVLQIRAASAEDRSAILDVVREAFSAGGRDGREELDIVRAIWEIGAAGQGLELVCVVDGVVVGHVLGSWGQLNGEPVIGVAPLAVSPGHQGQGVGTALMEEMLGRAEDARLPLLVLLGDPAYYGRFGFEPAGPLGIFYKPVGLDSPYLQVRRLAAYRPGLSGEYLYSWEFATST